jgi:hypothetical protein
VNEDMTMDRIPALSKAAVTRLFVGGILAGAAGVVLGLAALWAAFDGGVIVVGGPEVVTVNGGSAAWTVIGLVVAAWLAFAGGALAILVSWIGALLNTVHLEDKTWFAALLVLGLVSFGLVAMVGYVLFGPDGTRRPLAQAGGSAATAT